MQRRILIIDDNLAFLTLARRRLRERGYTVSIHEYPTESPVTIRHLNPDIVLINIAMRGLSEEKLSYLIGASRRFREISIIFYTSQTDASLRATAARHGAEGYIGACDVPRVCDTVSSYLSN